MLLLFLLFKLNSLLSVSQSVALVLRKLSISNCVSSFSQLFRMICVILSLIIGSNLVALSFIHKSQYSSLGITLVQYQLFVLES